jgi:hypothetical protein
MIVGKGRTFLAFVSVMSLANCAPSGAPDLTAEVLPDGSSLSSSFVMVVRVSATLEAFQPQRDRTRLEEVSHIINFKVDELKCMVAEILESKEFNTETLLNQIQTNNRNSWKVIRY